MRTLLFFISLVCLQACARVGEMSEYTPILHPQTLTQSSGDDSKAPFFRQGTWPSESWWTAFNAPALNLLMQEALSQNPRLGAVLDKVEVARQEAKIARSPLFPSIFFDSELDWGRVSENGLIHRLNPSLGTIYSLVDLTLDFTYQIDFWGKNRNQLKAAIGEYKSQITESKQVELIITTELAKAYFALEANLERKAIYQELIQIKEKLLQLDETLFTHALDNKLKPLGAVESLGDVEKELDAVIEQIEESKHGLNILAARGPKSNIEGLQGLHAPAKELNLPCNINSDLLVRRPDLMAQIWHIDALALEVKAAYADFFPQVDLKGLLGLDSIGFKDLINWASRTLKLTPSIHLPIFKAGEIQAKHRRRQAELNLGIENYNEMLLQALREVQNAVSRVEKTYFQKETQKLIMNQALAKLELQELRTQVGIDSQIQFLEMRAEYLVRELEEVMITYGQYVATIELIRALGGGYQFKDVARLNSGE